jgi:acyl-CoA dehydrogenase
VSVVQLPEELVALREAIRTFIQREVAPREALYAQEITETGTFAALQQEKRALRKRSAAEGYYSLFMPEEAGGGGVGHLGLVLCTEECMRHGLLLAMPGGVLPSVEGPTPILLDGTPEQQERYLQPTMRAEREACFALTEPDAGSDATRIRTRAERVDGGWVINGRKHFITHAAEADYVILFAVTDPGKGARGGISCFLVDKDSPGFEVGRRQRTMYDEHQAELVFSDCRVGDGALLGKEGYGFYSAMRWINGGRVSIAAMAVGAAQHLYERMLEYAKVREAFGRRIGANQYVQGMVVDSLAELTQARLLVYDLAARLDAGADGRQEAAMAKYVATEMVGRVADRAIQVFGGNGFMTEMGVERLARFVRGMRLYEGTSEILKANIAKTLGLDEPTPAPAATAGSAQPVA